MKSEAPMHLPVHIIAEAGSNHNGDPGLAEALIRVAGQSGADSVKFQFINAEGLYIPFFVDRGQRHRNEVYERRRSEQLAEEQWEALFAVARKLGVPASASVFDDVGVTFAHALNVPYVKVASTDLPNTPLLEQVAQTGIPAIVSTGMATLAEIEAAVEVFADVSALERLTLLHCVSVYPCAVRDTRLFMIDVLRSAFGVPVGFSDHTLGTEAAVMAVAMGATVIEKHFTLDRTLSGFDHAHALDPAQLRSFVEVIREAEATCSRTPEKVSVAERETGLRARRGLYAARDLEAGERLRAGDVLIVRPKAEMGPQDLRELIGTVVQTPIQQYEPLRLAGGIQPGKSDWIEARAYWEREMRAKGMGGEPTS